MYGARDAAQNWAEDCVDTMELGCFEGQRISVYIRPEKDRTRIHGGDFVGGSDKDLKWAEGNAEKRQKLKTKILGNIFKRVIIICQ